MKTLVGREAKIENKEVKKKKVGSILIAGVRGEERPGAPPLHCGDP